MLLQAFLLIHTCHHSTFTNEAVLIRKITASGFRSNTIMSAVSIFLTDYKFTVSIKVRSIVTLLNRHKTWSRLGLMCVQDILYDLYTPGYTGKLEMSGELSLSRQQSQLESKANTIVRAATLDRD